MRPMYDRAPPTGRKSSELSFSHEGMDLDQLVESLPDKAVIFDIGAGSSPFGHDIARVRDDITWIQVDPRYGDSTSSRTTQGKRLRRQLENTPRLPNVHYISGDVLNLPFQGGIADRVYSSALVPHLCMTSKVLAARAVHNMAQLTRSDGKLSVTGFESYKKGVEVSGTAYRTYPDQTVAQIIESMTLPRIDSIMQRAVNYYRSFVAGDTPSH